MALSLVVHSPALGARLITLATKTDRLASLPAATAAGLGILSAVLFLLSFLMTIVAISVMVHGAFRVLRGATPRIGESVQAVAGRWNDVIGLTIQAGLVVVIGWALGFFPGIAAYCGLFVAIPALLVERLPAGKALTRSWSLTDGYKRFIVFILLGVLIVWIGTSHWLPELAGSSQPLSPPHALELALSAVGGWLVAAVLTAFQAVAAGVAYHDLRVFREGLSEDQVSAIFD